MNGLVRRVGRKVKSLLRPAYARFQVLPRIRHACARWKSKVLQNVHGRSYSPDNLRAMQALSGRRFQPDAIPGHVALTGYLPEIDVSAVTYNSAKWLDNFIASLCEQDYPLGKLHLRFVDHGSGDETLAKLNQLLNGPNLGFGSIAVIRQDNLGFGAGHNRAIREGRSQYCLVTNVDLEFRPDSLTALMHCALADAQGTVASWELRQIPYEHPKYYDPVTLETNWSSHACILIRRAAYERVGGYDPRLFMYAEDVELSYRFRSYGYALKYVPRATVHHYTYKEAGEVKPMQYSGSTVGNVYVRVRYGSGTDRTIGLALYASLFFMPSPCAGAKKALLRNAGNLVRNWRHFSAGRGDAAACFPFRAFDYEFRRDGAFWDAQPVTGEDLPVVTIITRTYRGRAMFLEQAMQSVFNQTYPCIELLVVEDGGDTQQPLVERMSGQAPAGFILRFLPMPKLGRSSAGNAGLAAASGHYVMFLDDDDLLFADHVETLVSAMQSDPELSAAYALAVEVQTDVNDEKTHYLETDFATPSLFYQEWDHEVMKDHNFIPIQALLFKRKLYEERGGFDTELDQLEDWNLWLRYGYRERFIYVPKTTSLFRSPSDPDLRLSRALKLHEVYHQARDKAFDWMKRWDGQAESASLCSGQASQPELK